MYSSSIIGNSKSKNLKNRYHLLFISLLLINYFFPLLIFNEITLFYHDNLDGVIAWNHILGKFYRGEPVTVDIFLAGKIKIETFQHLLKPYSLLYGIFDIELAYWTIHFLFKITCYVSFFLLAKKINKNFFLCCLAACLFACINTRTTEGFGIAIFPYLIYLILYKKNLNIKHYLVIIFFSLNTDIVGGGIFVIPFVILVLFIIDQEIIKRRFLNILKILTVFFFFIIISSSNLIYAQLFNETFHRAEYVREAYPFLINIKNFFLTLFQIPTKLDWLLFYNLPSTIFLIPLFFFSFISKNKTVYKFLILIFFIHLSIFFSNLEIISSLRNNSSGLIKTYNFTWIKRYLPILHIFLLLYLTRKKEWFYKFLLYSSLISILFFQINSSLTPIGKKYLQRNGNDYKNIYTFKGYYSYNTYKEIKKVVRNKRVLSIGLDPMVAVVNNIKTIDGYYSLYPLSYKKKFRTIIQEELEKNEKLQKYYDHWGNRVYAFISDPNNILINFKAAKEIGADYVISKYNLNSDDLVLKCKKCRNNLYLYEIK